MVVEISRREKGGLFWCLVFARAMSDTVRGVHGHGTCGRIVVDMTDSLAHSSICYYNRKVDDNTMH
jgi:hypothetical protein